MELCFLLRTPKMTSLDELMKRKRPRFGRGLWNFSGSYGVIAELTISVAAQAWEPPASESWLQLPA